LLEAVTGVQTCALPIYRYGLNEAGNGHRFLVHLDKYADYESCIMAAAIELEQP
jgi:hypothetical protein